jgi:hypothetical protein
VPKQSQANASLSAEAFALMYSFRRARGSLADTGHRTGHNARMLAQLQKFGTKRLEFSDALFQAALLKNKAETDWIEARLGKPFPEFRRRPGAVIYGSDDDVERYAMQVLPEFRTWAAARFAGETVSAATPAEAIEDLYRLCR